jgi:alcohol dehydrogenase
MQQVKVIELGMIRAQDVGIADISDVSYSVTSAWSTMKPHFERVPRGSVLIVGGEGGSDIGLYAITMAKALGLRNIEYLDTHIDRLEKAWMMGARVKEGPPPMSHGSHPITLNCSEDPAGLACAIRSTQPGGVCFNTARGNELAVGG